MKALAYPETHERIIGLGADIVAAGPRELASLIRSEIPKWIKVAKSTGIKAD
jgi:tripartite-type tricarboxylate transporter receptor subunit TctC